MDFVNDIYLIASKARGVICLFPQATDFVNATIACGIYLYHIQGPAFGDGTAHFTGIARFAASLFRTIDRFGQDASHAGLACTSRAAEKISMSYLTTLDSVTQSLGYRLLPHHLT
jgi:hypothetical protein